MKNGQDSVCLQSQHSRGQGRRIVCFKANLSSTMRHCLRKTEDYYHLHCGKQGGGHYQLHPSSPDSVLILIRPEEFLSFILFNWTKTGPLLFNKHPLKTHPPHSFILLQNCKYLLFCAEVWRENLRKNFMILIHKEDGVEASILSTSGVNWSL